MSGYAVLNAVNTAYKEIPWRYGVLGLDPCWFICEVHARIRRIILDGYGVLRQWSFSSSSLGYGVCF
nr:hypothetical protein [Tanacetum cinerariifolium]